MYDWKKTLLAPNDTMEDAVKVITNESLGIALISDDDGKLVGTVSVGDVR